MDSTLDLTGARLRDVPDPGQGSEGLDASRTAAAQCRAPSHTSKAPMPLRTLVTVPAAPCARFAGRKMQPAPSIELPNQAAECVSHIAVDIGGSLIKLVYFSQDASSDDEELPSRPSTSQGSLSNLQSQDSSSVEAGSARGGRPADTQTRPLPLLTGQQALPAQALLSALHRLQAAYLLRCLPCRSSALCQV